MKLVFLILLLAYLSCTNTCLGNISTKNYQAIVLGKVIKKQIKKSDNFYITEYKLKTKKWLFKKPEIKQAKYLTIKILGGEVPEKGIVIKVSTAPNYIPFKKEAIFLLENNKVKQKDTFTLSKEGVLADPFNSDNLCEIRELIKKLEEI